MLRAPQIRIFLWTTSCILVYFSCTIFLQIEIILRNRCSLKSQLKKKMSIIGLIRSFAWKIVYELSFLNVPFLCRMWISEVLTGLSGMVFLHHNCLKGWVKTSLQLNLTLMGRFMLFQVVIIENTWFYCFSVLLEAPVKVCQDMYRGLKLQSSMESWKLLLQPKTKHIATKLPSGQVRWWRLYATAVQEAGAYVTSCSLC